jgi:hypothetical protein
MFCISQIVSLHQLAYFGWMRLRGPTLEVLSLILSLFDYVYVYILN